jgi:hypothetical protein
MLGDNMRHILQFQPDDIRKALAEAQKALPLTGSSLNLWLRDFTPSPDGQPRLVDQVMLGFFAMAADVKAQLDQPLSDEEKISNLVMSFLHFINVGITLIDGEFGDGNLNGN